MGWKRIWGYNPPCVEPFLSTIREFIILMLSHLNAQTFFDMPSIDQRSCSQEAWFIYPCAVTEILMSSVTLLKVTSAHLGEWELETNPLIPKFSLSNFRYDLNRINVLSQADQ